jgi:hypothetical protein
MLFFVLIPTTDPKTKSKGMVKEVKKALADGI